MSDREALMVAERALRDVVRYFDGQLPPAGFPLASVVKPALRTVTEALDDRGGPPDA
jgi:hypothetical protein